MKLVKFINISWYKLRATLNLLLNSVIPLPRNLEQVLAGLAIDMIKFNMKTSNCILKISFRLTLQPSNSNNNFIVLNQRVPISFITKDPLYRRLLLHITEQSAELAPPEKITRISGTTEVVSSSNFTSAYKSMLKAGLQHTFYLTHL